MQGVGGGRFHGERQAVAAQSATVPLVAPAPHRGERGIPAAAVPYFVGHHGGSVRCTGHRRQWRPIPVLERRTVGAGLVVGQIKPGQVRMIRRHIALWQPYSNTDQGAGRRARTGRRGRAERVGPASGPNARSGSAASAADGTRLIHSRQGFPSSPIIQSRLVSAGSPQFITLGCRAAQAVAWGLPE